MLINFEEEDFQRQVYLENDLLFVEKTHKYHSLKIEVDEGKRIILSSYSYT